MQNRPSAAEEFRNELETVPKFETAGRLSFYFASLGLLLATLLGRPAIVKLISWLIWRTIRKIHQSATTVMLCHDPTGFAQVSRDDGLWIIRSFSSPWFTLFVMLLATCPFQLQKKLFQQIVMQLQAELGQSWIDEFAPKFSPKSIG